MQMYFSTLPVTRDKTLVIKHKDEEIVFIVTSLTQQVRKTVGRDDHMHILVSYFQEKGIEDEVFDLYKRIHTTVENDLVSKPSKKYFKLLKELETYFVFEDVLAHVQWYNTNVAKILTDAVKADFDNKVTVNGQGTRAKTYTVQDYMELLALAVASKAFYGPIIFAITMNVQASTKHQEPLVAYEWLSKTSLGEWPPFKKIHAFAEENILGPFKPQLATYAYTKMIGTDAIVDRMVGIYIFKLFAYSVVTNHEKNLASAMFSMTRNEFGHVPRLIEKEAGASDTGKESVFEMHRISSSITQGDKAMFHVYAESPHNMFVNLCELHGHTVTETDHERLEELLKQLEPLDNNRFNPGVIRLIEIGVSRVMHPEVINYLSRGHLRNICAVLTLYTWLYGNKTIALLFTTLMFNDNHNRIQNSYRSKLDLELLNKVESQYGVVRETKSKDVVTNSLVHDTINEIVDLLTLGSYMYINVGYTEQKVLSLDKDIKNDILSFIDMSL